MQDLEKSFNAFLKGEAKVAVIKGSWGVGKTYLWNEYITKKIADNKKTAKKLDGNLNQIAYSYISLFGKKSISDVKKSIFHSAEPIRSGAEIKELFEGKFTNSSRLLNLVPWINRFTQGAQNIPAVGEFSNMISSFEYLLVDNYVICFDDLERKADTLAIKEVMGLIDELAIHKNCKVILIFNENALDDDIDKTKFNSYREKVVDIELNYEPTCVENMKHVFPDDSEHLSIITDVVNKLDIKNIRVLRKIHWMIKKFFVFFEELPDSLKEEFITHAIPLCQGYFIRSKNLPYETLKFYIKETSWMSFVYDEEKEENLAEKERIHNEEEKNLAEEERALNAKKYGEIAINLKLSPSYFYPHIIHYLEQGFVNGEELKATVSYLLEWVEIEQFKIKFRNVWGMYSDSFDDNLEDFIIALKNIIKEDMDRLQLSDFSSIITPLEEFGKESVLGYIEDYVERHKESLKNIDPGSWSVEKIKNEDLKAKIYEIYKENKHFSIDDVAERIAEHQSYGLEDVGYLSSLDKEYFRKWMKSNPKNLVNKIRKGLFIFRNSGGHQSQEKIDIINLNVRGALLDIADENVLNKKRVKYIYDIE